MQQKLFALSLGLAGFMLAVQAAFAGGPACGTGPACGAGAPVPEWLALAAYARQPCAAGDAPPAADSPAPMPARPDARPDARPPAAGFWPPMFAVRAPATRRPGALAQTSIPGHPQRPGGAAPPLHGAA